MTLQTSTIAFADGAGKKLHLVKTSGPATSAEGFGPIHEAMAVFFAAQDGKEKLIVSAEKCRSAILSFLGSAVDGSPFHEGGKMPAFAVENPARGEAQATVTIDEARLEVTIDAAGSRIARMEIHEARIIGACYGDRINDDFGQADAFDASEAGARRKAWTTASLCASRLLPCATHAFSLAAEIFCHGAMPDFDWHPGSAARSLRLSAASRAGILWFDPLIGILRPHPLLGSWRRVSSVIDADTWEAILAAGLSFSTASERTLQAIGASAGHVAGRLKATSHERLAASEALDDFMPALEEIRTKLHSHVSPLPAPPPLLLPERAA